MDQWRHHHVGGRRLDVEASAKSLAAQLAGRPAVEAVAGFRRRRGPAMAFRGGENSLYPVEQQKRYGGGGGI